jgi:hypothetical protein
VSHRPLARPTIALGPGQGTPVSSITWHTTVNHHPAQETLLAG